MMTRRKVVRLMGSASAWSLIAPMRTGFKLSTALNGIAANDSATPPLAPGNPLSPERQALIETFKKRSDGLEKRFEAHTHKSDWVMPYRLFRPAATGKLPLVVYLHGSGGLGDDNEKQLGLGNIFGTARLAAPRKSEEFSLLRTGAANRPGMGQIRFIATK